MAKIEIVKASTSYTVNVFVQDSSKTDGSGLAGLVFNTAGLTAYYMRPRAASVAITLATLAAVTSAWSSGGFKEIDATNAPGTYRLDIPDAALATGADWVNVYLRGAANMAPVVLEIQLTGIDLNDATAGGMSRVDAAVSSRMATFSLPTNFSSLSVDAGGVVKANLAQILGTALTETAGLLAAGFKAFFNVGSPTGTLNSLPGAVPGASGGLPTTDASNAVKVQSGAGAGQISLAAGLVTVGTNNDKAGYTASSVTGAVGSVAAGGITAASFGAGAIDANAIATDAIGAAEVSAAAVTKIQAGLALAGGAVTLTSGERDSVAAALLDLANGVEAGVTLRQVARLLASAVAGKTDGSGTTTVHFRDLADSKNRLSITLSPTGDRTAVTRDVT